MPNCNIEINAMFIIFNKCDFSRLRSEKSKEKKKSKKRKKSVSSEESEESSSDEENSSSDDDKKKRKKSKKREVSIFIIYIFWNDFNLILI